jgi:hypothetical protein
MYQTHEDVSDLQADYICSVAGVSSISELSIEDVNLFAKEIEQWYDEQATESECQTYYEGAF